MNLFNGFGKPKANKMNKLFTSFDRLLEAYEEFKLVCEKYGDGQLLAKSVMHLAKFMDQIEDGENQIIGGRILLSSVILDRMMRLDQSLNQILRWVIEQDEQSFKDYLKSLNAIPGDA